MTLYTLGNSESYDAALAELARGERVALTKVGRYSPDTPTDYPGGSVWATARDAAQWLNWRYSHGGTPLGYDPGIYELDGDWESDTITSTERDALESPYPYRDLLYDRPILRRVDVDSEPVPA